MNIDLTNNTVECIKKVSNFGSDLYQNICNGTQSIVAWGSMDWIAGIVLTILLLLLLGIIGFGIYGLLGWLD